jgi:uncharacterized protein
MGVFVGIFMGVVGIVPVGMLASLFNGDWYAIGILVFGLALTFGARIIAIMLAAWIDRGEAGINSNSPSLSLAPQPSKRALVTVLGLVLVGSVGVWLVATQRTVAEDPFIAEINRGDFATALRRIRPLAEQGNASAQNELAFLYSYGYGVPQNDAEAMKWYRKAADQGNADAQSNLGRMEAAAAYGRRDYATALRLYRPLADQGDTNAQTFLGFSYANGQDVPRNYAEAVKWYRLAADQGDAVAQYDLGLMYDDGYGVPQDYVRAHMWFNLSAAQGDQDGIKNRDDVSLKMTPAQLAEAQKLAREWKPKSTRR